METKEDRNVVQHSFEALIIRNIGGAHVWLGDMEIYLRCRSEREPYGGLWCLPGDVYKPNDSEVAVARRVAEFASVGFTSYLKLEELKWRSGDMRFHSDVYRCHLQGNPPTNSIQYWFLVSELPRDIIPQHRFLIERQAEKILAAERQYAVTG